MILPFLRQLLPWVTPPIIGAIIGYVTNDIAIRMLFRPLKEVRVFGLRVPFTPGIFPKERYVLSRSIGRMVSRELITEEALRRQIGSQKTRAQLAASVSSLSSRLLSTPLSGLSANASSALSSSLKTILGDLLTRFFSSRAGIYAVRDILGRIVSSLGALKARELANRLELRPLLSERLLPLLAEKGTRESLALSVALSISERAADLLSDPLIDAAAGIVEPLMDPAVDRLVEWLHSSRMHAELESKGRRLLSGILEKLNLLQRFLLSAGQFDRRLDEKMPEIVDDTIATLEATARDPVNQRAILSMIAEALRDWRGSLASGRDGQGMERLTEALTTIVSGFLSELESPERREKAADTIMDKLLGTGDPTLGNLALRFLGLREEQIVDGLSNRLLEYLGRKETSGLFSHELAGFLERFLSDNAQTPIGTILHLDSEAKGKLDAFLTDRLIGLVDAKLPEILKGIDVEELVVQKIDALDVKDVERLLLEVIASHLRWIDVFGAILGFVIGLFQLLLRVLRVS